jgi:hypothetical protein
MVLKILSSQEDKRPFKNLQNSTIGNEPLDSIKAREFLK